uniref:Uncharacterized protein n=1 Tax=Hyaloperonospora arabidopsidis (strain Emoy2) TaxID=559515 RepID=M4BWC0_HYAAE
MSHRRSDHVHWRSNGLTHARDQVAFEWFRHCSSDTVVPHGKANPSGDLFGRLRKRMITEQDERSKVCQNEEPFACKINCCSLLETRANRVVDAIASTRRDVLASRLGAKPYLPATGPLTLGGKSPIVGPGLKKGGLLAAACATGGSAACKLKGEQQPRHPEVRGTATAVVTPHLLPTILLQPSSCRPGRRA